MGFRYFFNKAAWFVLHQVAKAIAAVGICNPKPVFGTCDGHIKKALNIPLTELTDPASMANLEDDQNIYIHCASGYRSIIAASLLKRQGIHNFYNVSGGWNKIKLEGKIQTEKETSVLN